MLRRFAALLFAVLAAGPVCALDFEPRTWTNDRGDKLEGPLVGLSSSTAYLEQDGKRIPAPINRLSEQDQQYLVVARQVRRKREWASGTAHATFGVLSAVETSSVTLKVGAVQTEMPLSRLSEDDLQLLKTVFPSKDFTTTASFELPYNATMARDWTDVSGKVINAELRGVEGDKVVLFFKNREWRVPLSRLSQADQDFIASAQHRNDPTTALASADAPPERDFPSGESSTPNPNPVGPSFPSGSGPSGSGPSGSGPGGFGPGTSGAALLAGD